MYKYKCCVLCFVLSEFFSLLFCCLILYCLNIDLLDCDEFFGEFWNFGAV